MRTFLFFLSAVLSFSLLIVEQVVAQVGPRDYKYDLPSIPTPGKKEEPAPPPENQAGIPEGTCDRKKNTSLACRRDVFQGKQTRLVRLLYEETRLQGTWDVRTLVTMTDDEKPKEIEINPTEVPLRGLTWKGTSVASISDVPRNLGCKDRQGFQIRSDAVTVDFCLSGEGVPELAFACRMVRFNQSGDNLVCVYHDKVADKFIAKGYVTFTRRAPPRPRPEIARDPYYDRYDRRNYGAPYQPPPFRWW